LSNALSSGDGIAAAVEDDGLGDTGRVAVLASSAAVEPSRRWQPPALDRVSRNRDPHPHIKPYRLTRPIFPTPRLEADKHLQLHPEPNRTDVVSGAHLRQTGSRRLVEQSSQLLLHRTCAQDPVLP
jgi:hypothetical protein